MEILLWSVVFLVFQAGDVVVGQVQWAQAAQSAEGEAGHRLQSAVCQGEPGHTQHWGGGKRVFCQNSQVVAVHDEDLQTLQLKIFQKLKIRTKIVKI